MSLHWCGGTSKIIQLDLVVLTQMCHLMSGQLSWQHQQLPVITSDERLYGLSKQAPYGSKPQTDSKAIWMKRNSGLMLLDSLSITTS